MSPRVIALALPLLALIGVAAPAEAFNCAVPALVNKTKKAVCASASLTSLDRAETSKAALIRSRLRVAGDTFGRDRTRFIATRDGCRADTRCLRATYNAQIRLYDRLGGCAAKSDVVACTQRTIEKHRQDLSRSL